MAGGLLLAERARVEALSHAGHMPDAVTGLIGGDRSTVCRGLDRGSRGDGRCHGGHAQAPADA